jgi:hypothetical protein
MTPSVPLQIQTNYDCIFGAKIEAAKKPEKAAVPASIVEFRETLAQHHGSHLVRA